MVERPMSSQLSVSTRESIKWDKDVASEQTDTLVLIGEGGHFVDLRIFKDRSRGIDWALAGRKLVVQHDGPSSKAEFHGVFDSRSLIIPDDKLATAPPDEAWFKPLDETRTLETGRMMNPDRDWAVEPYEEVWIDQVLPSDTPSVFLATAQHDAFLGRVGRWQIGLSKTNETYHGVRWELDERDEWQVVWSSADPVPLIPIAAHGLEAPEGQLVVHAGRTWLVHENNGGA